MTKFFPQQCSVPTHNAPRHKAMILLRSRTKIGTRTPEKFKEEIIFVSTLRGRDWEK